ncbi:MAG: diguanylate cyclase [Deltaproteobacteria bacterium]|uniref:Diguanylate cyclase n=1 Tax=Candidatus Zymogenus saltonus TaxID=2844893 RepID=A0A9D8KEY6_9DELT|nr:diguanylate cyclase [Candidatus Zymogenus saltonus]
MVDVKNKKGQFADSGFDWDLKNREAEKSENRREPNAETIFQSEELYRTLIETLNDGLGLQDENGIFTYLNDKLSEMFGYSRDEMIGRPVTDFLDDHNRKVFEAQMAKRMKGDSSHYEIVWTGKDGRKIPTIMSPRPIFNDNGTFKGSFAIFTDITERKKMEEELIHLSITDDLTGLYNHRYFYKKISEEVNRAKRMSYPLTLLIFDIDDFKSFNDTYGHIAGDDVLRKVGRIATKNIRKDVDSAFRYGGDEFAIILPYTDREEAIALSARISRCIEREINKTRISIGIASSNHHKSFEEVIKAADEAMYVEKSLRKENRSSKSLQKRLFKKKTA